MENCIVGNLQESLKLHSNILHDNNFIRGVIQAADSIISSLKDGGKIIVAGNGGSAADAQHFTAEIVGRYQRERKGLPAIAITTNSSLITALANDFSFEMLFARQIEALANEEDVFVGITTSGNSPNIIEAFVQSREIGVKSIGLLGRDGGKALEMCDIPIVVPHARTARIQEIHILVIHAMCDVIDRFNGEIG